MSGGLPGLTSRWHSLSACRFTVSRPGAAGKNAQSASIVADTSRIGTRNRRRGNGIGEILELLVELGILGLEFGHLVLHFRPGFVGHRLVPSLLLLFEGCARGGEGCIVPGMSPVVDSASGHQCRQQRAADP